MERGERVLIILIPHSERKKKGENRLLDSSIYREEITNEFKFIDESLLEGYERYEGVMFKGLNYKTIDKERKEKFKEKIVVVNPLEGLSKLEDLTPNYKIKFSDKLNGRTLLNYWRDSEIELVKAIRDREEIIGFLPEEHKKVVSEKIKFINYKLYDNAGVIIGHSGKFKKGICIREIIEGMEINEAVKKYNLRN